MSEQPKISAVALFQQSAATCVLDALLKLYEQETTRGQIVLHALLAVEAGSYSLGSWKTRTLESEIAERTNTARKLRAQVLTVEDAILSGNHQTFLATFPFALQEFQYNGLLPQSQCESLIYLCTQLSENKPTKGELLT